MPIYTEKQAEDIMSDRQYDQYLDLKESIDLYGKYDKTATSNGSHYISHEENIFSRKGIKCANCIFYNGPRQRTTCSLVRGQINVNGLCKFWIIPESYIKEK